VYARKNKIGMMTGKEIIKHYQNDIINPGLDFILKNMRIMQKVAKGEPFKYKIFPGNTAYYAYFEDNFLKRKLPKHVQDNKRTYKTLKAYFSKAIAKQIKAGEELASREDKSQLT